MNLRGAQPVVDYQIKDFVSSLHNSNDLYNNKIPTEFTEKFFNWINSSQLNSLKGLENFTNQKLTAGTAQTFDHWYWRHKDKTFRFFKGEFMYHSALLKHGGRWNYIDDRKLETGDAVIISVPFSDYGTQHPKLEFLLHNCNIMNIPVLLDFAYYPCAKNINLNLDSFPCVETVAFSISKAFYGAEFLRVGMRLERLDTDDGIDVFNSVNMINRVSVGIAIKLIERFSVDHNWNTYADVYHKVCNELNLQPTDCIMFGLGDETYQHLNRGSGVNRVCISEPIGKIINN